MSKLTPLGNLPYPEQADTADIPTHLQSLAEAVDGRTVLRFTDGSGRDAKVTAPVAGMVAWLSNPGRLTYYTGTVWALVSPSPAFLINYTPGTSVSASYAETLTGVPTVLAVSFAAPPSGMVMVTVGAVANGTAATANAFMSVAVKQGTTVTVAPSDDRAAVSTGTGRTSVSSQSPVTGLTPGIVYTAVPNYRTSVATSTATFDNRFIRVDPLT
ncbi:hypothetical protein [Streptomyces sp. NPDC048650]|uniref:hypothetical protein n=1 Tax=unclassified Streptomyces TaxID=2593676 RepID=UPI00371C4C13